MSRITGSDALKMFEAYAEVYASEEQELTEEQVWEEVENWVNSLLEEGYDLSDYTWEEMYEEYLKEYTRQADRPGQTPAEARSAQQSAKERGASAAKSYQAKADAYKPDPLKTIRNFLSSPGAISQGRMDSERDIRPSTTKPPKPPSSTDHTSRFSRQRNAAPGISDIRGGKGKITPTRTSTDTTPTPSPRPSEVKVKPATPTPGTKAAGPESIKPKTPNPLLAGGDIRRMQQASQMRQKGITVTSDQLKAAERTKPTPPVKAATPSQAVAATTKPVAPEVKATNTIAAKPSSAMSQDAIRKQRLNMEMEYDAYDLVLEYLLETGHAATVDEAHYVMMEMDAQHIKNIVEAPGEWFGGLRDRARASRSAQMQSSTPTPKAVPNMPSPFAKPASRNDSGRLTTYGAGGGAAAERAGQTRSQVMQQGAKNLETKNKPNPGPNFGR
jgi:hypothetical protein